MTISVFMVAILDFCPLVELVQTSAGGHGGLFYLTSLYLLKETFKPGPREFGQHN